MKSYLRSVPKTTASVCVNLNSFTDASDLRNILQQHVDKRSGRNYGPVGASKLIYFIDDLNMPYGDTYGKKKVSANFLSTWVCQVLEIYPHKNF